MLRTAGERAAHSTLDSSSRDSEGTRTGQALWQLCKPRTTRAWRTLAEQWWPGPAGSHSSLPGTHCGCRVPTRGLRRGRQLLPRRTSWAGVARELPPALWGVALCPLCAKRCAVSVGRAAMAGASPRALGRCTFRLVAVLTLQLHRNHSAGGAPAPESLIRQVWGGAWDSGSRTCRQVTPTLPVLWPHSENRSSKVEPTPGGPERHPAQLSEIAIQ